MPEHGSTPMDPPMDPLRIALLRQMNSKKLQEAFERDGFVVFPEGALAMEDLQQARDHLEAVFRGHYDLGRGPSKALTNIDPDFTWEGIKFDEDRASMPRKKSSARVRTMQLINIWHSDSFFRSLVTSPSLGALVAHVCGWERRGCRFVQDQVWVKPPGAGALSFHRDTTYFDFIPKEVATVWFTLDSTLLGEGGEDILGPLEFCRGSHLWGHARRGSANQFFDPDYQAMLRDAATREIKCASDAPPVVNDAVAWGVECAKRLDIAKVHAAAGGFSIHNGNTWHGSGPNRSPNCYRRGIGMHFVPGDVVFNLDDVGTLWRPYTDPGGSPSLPEEWFPWVFRPSSSVERPQDGH